MRHVNSLCAALAEIALASAVGPGGSAIIKSALPLILLRSRRLADRLQLTLA